MSADDEKSDHSVCCAPSLTDDTAEGQRRRETSDEHEHQTDKAMERAGVDEVRLEVTIATVHFAIDTAEYETTA